MISTVKSDVCPEMMNLIQVLAADNSPVSQEKAKDIIMTMHDLTGDEKKDAAVIIMNIIQKHDSEEEILRSLGL